MNLWWPSDGSDEWLTRADGMLAVTLLSELCRRRRLSGNPCEPVLEVGVWKGGWTSVILMNLPDVELQGVDPYPRYESVRAYMQSNLTTLGIDDRFLFSPSVADLADGACYSMIHIDGEHSERAVEAELEFATDHLTDDGIIIVDDFRHIWFPGIASALFRFLGKGDLALFAVSANKAYLPRSAYADAYYEQLEKEFAGSVELPVWNHYRQWDGDDLEYIQAPNVCGQRVLICGRGEPSRAKRLALDLIPPIGIRTLAKVKQRIGRR